jgi:hypothetical protein
MHNQRHLPTFNIKVDVQSHQILNFLLGSKKLNQSVRTLMVFYYFVVVPVIFKTFFKTASMRMLTSYANFFKSCLFSSSFLIGWKDSESR